jgi:hypothetical protein
LENSLCSGVAQQAVEFLEKTFKDKGLREKYIGSLA